MPLFMPLFVLILAAGGLSSPNPIKADPAQPIYAALNGAWVGALEYRDYSNNSRVVLPTILDIQQRAGTAELSLHYIYDDGPTKVVQDTEIVTVNVATATYTVVSDGGKQTDKDSLVGTAAFLKVGAGTLVRSGTGKENGKPVDVRTTMTISPGSLTILKETRVVGGAYQFRDQYQLVRVKPASSRASIGK